MSKENDPYSDDFKEFFRKNGFPYLPRHPPALSFHQTTELVVRPQSTGTFHFPTTRPLRVVEVAMRVLEGVPEALLVRYVARKPFHQIVLLPADWLDARFKTESYRKIFEATLLVGHEAEPIDIINRSDKPGRVLIVPHLKVIT
jgi:hypothetical protein